MLINLITNQQIKFNFQIANILTSKVFLDWVVVAGLSAKWVASLVQTGIAYQSDLGRNILKMNFKMISNKTPFF
jgi:isopentenyl diphosphate isomerase/L-lactate dehydrogenase-like FMN-dependent dehydrogenase